MITTTLSDDMKRNIDCWLRQLPVAYRTRRCTVGRWNEISIRNQRNNGAKTERQKILDGECGARLFVFDFTDAWVLCGYAEIVKALHDNAGYEKPNHDGQTSAYYIGIENIRHILIPKIEAVRP